ncbi:uncharacterized protein LOC114534590 [Dendronephthya gigantea]|uniref:uncharacterized protein LOC114534590 n=1 Tax=Dendronephthya gigantea TaxID=151771 RepID=UPI00106D6A33|nr:uncharacterized protein LOC114534590 [Dendronephthya gigantea]
MSNEIGMDWDALAALMNIPYGKRDEIRMNASQYPDNTAKGQQILAFINESQNFDRHTLEKCVKELGRGDVKIEIHPEDECQDETIDGTEPPQPPCEFPPYENITLKNTPSPHVNVQIKSAYIALLGTFCLSYGCRQTRNR